MKLKFVSKNLGFKDDETMNFFCKEIARRITSPHKRNEMLLITGQVGGGKSYTAMEIARLISVYVAELKGGVPEDYFPSDLSHMAVMNEEELKRVFQIIGKKKWQIFILDDFGASYSSRNFMSKSNKAVNDLLQTWRTDECVVIITVPQGNFIDKLGREIMHHVAEMLQPIFNRQVNVADIRAVKPMRKGEPRYTYLQDGMGNKYKRHLFAKPPDAWCKLYDKIRTEQNAILKQKREAVMFVDEEDIPKEKKQRKTDIYKKAAKEYNPEIHGTKKEYCKKMGFNYQSYVNLI